MKINFMDGGMLFEINKKYKDYGQYAFDNDKDLINNLYKNYIDIGCKFITTSNYCFKPSYINDWKKYTQKSINIVQKFRNENVKIMGSIPPYKKSYTICEIDKDFKNFYKDLVNIFKSKVDFYIIETGFHKLEIIEIYNIINSIDKNTKVIVSLYPNKNHLKYIQYYLDLNIYGLFLNCVSLTEIIYFYNNYLINKNFNNKKFGFYCNNIDEKKYSQEIKSISSNKIELNLENYKSNNKLDQKDIISFLNNLKHDEIFIGGCCGYGVAEMKELFNLVKKL
tara:strand:- start:498 stop:1337 length:840 start_codon:yes stop_codon:yes gene_type:complete